MRYQKRDAAPAMSHSILRITPEEMYKSGTLTLTHMRPDGDGLLPAFVFTDVFHPSRKVRRLFTSGKEVFFYDEGEQAIERFSTGRTIYDVDAVNAFAAGYTGARQVENFCFASPKRTWFVEKFATYYDIGADAAVFFKDRLCLLSGETFSYSTPVEEVSFTNKELLPDLCGSVTIHRPGCGKFLGVGILYDKMYFIRERGIDKYEFNNEALSQKTTPVPYDKGRIVPKTIACSASGIWFLTEDGLCVFNGRKTELVEPFLAKTVETEAWKDFEASMWGERYCLHAKSKEGRYDVYIYDSVHEIPYWLGAEPDTFAADLDAYFCANGALYRLSDGYDGETTKSILRCKIELPENSLLEWVSFDGDGIPSLQLASEERSFSCDLRSGERSYLTRPMKGPIEVELVFGDLKFSFRALRLGLAKEKA